MAGGVPRSGGESLLSHGFAVPAPPEGKPKGLRPDHRSFRAGYQTGVRISRMKGTAERQALPPAFMRGEGHEVAGGVPRSGGESLLSHGFAVPAPPEGKPRGLRTVPAPRIYEGGVPPPQRRGRPSQSRFACQLSQRESQGCCAPFLPPAFMRGEGHAVAGGVPRSGGDCLLSHGFAVPAPPEGKPRGLRPDHRSFRAGYQIGVRISRMKGAAYRFAPQIPPGKIRFPQ